MTINNANTTTNTNNGSANTNNGSGTTANKYQPASFSKSLSGAYRRSRERFDEATSDFFEDHDLDWAFWLAAAVLVGLLLALCNYFRISVEPYVAIFGGEIGQPHAFPLLGLVMDMVSILITAGTASFVWGLVNFLQCQYLLIAFDKKFQQKQRRRASKLARSQKTEDPGVSSRMVRKARRRENGAFDFVNNWGFLLAIAATVVDLAVNVNYRPIIKNLGNFLAAKIGGNAALAVNWSHFGAVLLNMVSVEGIVLAILLVWRYLEDRYTND